MALNVLEIGYGSAGGSAVFSGGEVFADPAPNYFGVDLPSSRRSIIPDDFPELLAPMKQ